MAVESTHTDREIWAVHEEFYRAFAARDFDAMEKLWASSAQATCVHPSWNAARGREAVLISWQEILSSPDSPKIVVANATLQILGEGAAYVICEEHFNNWVLMATNILVREAGEWKMSHHHAGHLRTRLEVPPPKGEGGVN
jgi:ketosteroid isomerase-like protein